MFDPQSIMQAIITLITLSFTQIHISNDVKIWNHYITRMLKFNLDFAPQAAFKSIDF